MEKVDLGDCETAIKKQYVNYKTLSNIKWDKKDIDLHWSIKK